MKNLVTAEAKASRLKTLLAYKNYKIRNFSNFQQYPDPLPILAHCSFLRR